MARIRGGDRLKEALERLKNRLSKEATLRVGFLEGSTYPDGTSVPLVAAVNEFGRPDKGQPPRPFFRTMIRKNSGTWALSFRATLKNNNYDLDKSFFTMGVIVSDQLQASIREFWTPGLKASTIAAKGFDKPLIDTSHMLNSVSFDIKKRRLSK